MKTLKFLAGLSFLLLVSCVNVRSQSFYLPDNGYHSLTVRNADHPKGLTLVTVDDYLLFALDRDKDNITISLLPADSLKNAPQTLPIVVMKAEEADFSYVDPERQREMYYIKENKFNILLIKDGKISQNIRIEVAPPAAGQKRQINVSSRQKTIATLEW